MSCQGYWVGDWAIIVAKWQMPVISHILAVVCTIKHRKSMAVDKNSKIVLVLVAIFSILYDQCVTDAADKYKMEISCHLLNSRCCKLCLYQ